MTPYIYPKQAQVLILTATGHTTKQIAYKLGISQRTVMAHLQELKAKLNAGTRAQVVAEAMKLGILRFTDGAFEVVNSESEE